MHLVLAALNLSFGWKTASIWVGQSREKMGMWVAFNTLIILEKCAVALSTFIFSNWRIRNLSRLPITPAFNNTKIIRLSDTA